MEDAERLQGFPPGWTAPCYPLQNPYLSAASTRKTPENVYRSNAERDRWALIGNAVSVPVAEWIGVNLMNAYETVRLQERNSSLHSGASNVKFWWRGLMYIGT